MLETIEPGEVVTPSEYRELPVRTKNPQKI